MDSNFQVRNEIQIWVANTPSQRISEVQQKGLAFIHGQKVVDFFYREKRSASA